MHPGVSEERRPACQRGPHRRRGPQHGNSGAATDDSHTAQDSNQSPKKQIKGSGRRVTKEVNLTGFDNTPIITLGRGGRLPLGLEPVRINQWHRNEGNSTITHPKENQIGWGKLSTLQQTDMSCLTSLKQGKEETCIYPSPQQ